MASGEASKGWILHSLAQGRSFGPLSEDELRQYFRAGMVKSVDRLTAPGESKKRPAGEVALSIGENEPAGPPPPELVETPAPAPTSTIPDVPRAQLAAGMAPDPASEERAARAAAAMNIDMAAMMASSATPARRSNMWMLVLGTAVLIASLFFALSMAKKMAKPGAVHDTVTSAPTTVVADGPASGDSAPHGVETAVAGAAAMSQQDNATDTVFEEHNARANALSEAKDWASLEPMADAWSQEQPGRTEPLQYLAVAQASQGKYEPATQNFEKILAIDPNSPVKGMLADTYMQAQKPGKAATLYEQMLKSSPNDARLWNNFGAALNLSAQPVQAITALENAVRLDPSMKQAWTNLGNLYQSQGDQAKADAAFARGK